MYLVACDRGYELVGDEELICGSDGETNTFFGNPDDYPECVYLPGPCAKPRITNGWLTYDQGEFEIPYREETFVVCNGPNYGPKQTLVTCMGNNQWEPPIPVCTWRGKEIFPKGYSYTREDTSSFLQIKNNCSKKRMRISGQITLNKFRAHV